MHLHGQARNATQGMHCASRTPHAHTMHPHRQARNATEGTHSACSFSKAQDSTQHCMHTWSRTPHARTKAFARAGTRHYNKHALTVRAASVRHRKAHNRRARNTARTRAHRQRSQHKDRGALSVRHTTHTPRRKTKRLPADRRTADAASRKALATLSHPGARDQYDRKSLYRAQDLLPLGWRLTTSTRTGVPYYVELWCGHAQLEDPRSPTSSQRLDLFLWCYKQTCNFLAWSFSDLRCHCMLDSVALAHGR